MIRPGYGTVVLNPGTSGTVRLEMGAISRSAGGGIVTFGTSNATLPGPTRIVTTSNTNTNGILGPWATTGKQTSADVGNQYLRVGAGGVLETLTYSGTSVINDLTDATANYQLSVGGTLTGNRTANTIYISATTAATITLGANDLVLNGISRRVGSSGGAGYVTINSTGGRVVIGASNELVLAYGDFNITAPIVDGSGGAGRVVLGSHDYWGHGRGGWGNQHTFSGGLTYANATASGGFNFGTADGSTTASPIGTGTFTISGDPRYANLTGGGRIGTNNAQIWDVDFTFTSSGTGLHMGTGPVSLGLGAGPSRDVGVTGTVTIGGNISDGTYASFPVTSLTKSGAGLLVLSGSLLHTGSTGVSAGTLLISGSNPSTMGPMSATGGIMQFARRASLYGADATKYTAANLTTGSGAVLAVNVGGTGEFTSSDLDILKGLGTELTGFLPGSFLGIDTTNQSSGTFTYSTNVANPNSGANALGIAKLGGGTLLLSGSNSFTGGVSVRGGTLLLTAADQIGTGPMTLLSGTLSTSSDAFMTSSPLTFSGGALRVTGTSLTSLSTGRTNNFTAGAATQFDIADAANTFTVSQAINSGTSGSLVKLGPGTLVLSASSNYTGSTTIGSSGGAGGGTLRLSGAAWISGTTGTAAPLIYSGTLDTGGINVTTAAVTLGGGAAATNAGVTTGTGTLTLGGGVTYDATNNPGGATIAGNLSLGNANRTFNVGNSTGADTDLTISAGITSGTLTKSGAGVLLLSGTNTFSGTTTVSAGVLSASSTASLPGWDTGRYSVSGGAALALGSGFSDANVATVLAGGTFAANASIGFDTSGGDRTYGSAIGNFGANARGLTKLGSGTLTLSAANTYTGTTSILAGTLAVGITNAISTTSPISVAGGALDMVNSSSSGAVTVSVPGSSIIGVGTLTGSSYTFSNASGTVTASAILGGTAATLTKSNAGTATLTGLNTYRGTTTVHAGVLEFSSIADSGTTNASALGAPTAANSTIFLGSGATAATLRYVGSGTSSSNRGINLSGTTGGGGVIEAGGVGPLVLTGTISAAAGSKTLTLTGTSTAANSIGLIQNAATSGSLSVVKEGSGLWRLTGVSEFTGPFTLKNGTVVAAVNASTVNNSGVFGKGGAPIVGDTADGAPGTVALLAEASVTVYGVTVTPAGVGSTQTVLLGGASSNGTAFYAGNVFLDLGRNVSLVATTGGTTNFASNWRNGSGTGIPTVDVAIGAAGYTGTVKLAPPTTSGTLATTGAVSVRYGTALLETATTILDGAGTLTIDQGATLGGIGTVAGPLGGAGIVAPGNSPGVLTAEAFDASGGLGAAFEFSGTAAPNYASASNSLNDVLRLTGTSPFLNSTFGTSNVVNVYLPSSVAAGDVFLGGFFADNGGSFTSLIQNATYNYWVAGSGTHVYNSGTYVPLATIDPAWSVSVGTTPQTTSGTFANGDLVNGTVSTFTVVVPEPAAVALAGIGIAAAAWTLRRRRPPL
jgi:autotransporter-associated beta strand protein